MNTKTEKEYDFPVELIPIKANEILIPKKSAVIRTDTQQSIGIVSSQYGLLKHKDIIDSFRKALSDHKYEEKIEINKNGAHLFSTYRLPEIQHEVKKGDFVAMQFIAKNSYDGTKSFSLMLGALRLVCSNGMIIGNEFFSYSQKHMYGISSSNSLVLENRIVELITYFKDSIPVMKRMSDTKVKVPNEILFNQKYLSLPKYVINSAKEIFEKKQANTVWEYYNALTFVISHNLKKDNPQTKIDYTKEAWSAASKMI